MDVSSIPGIEPLIALAVAFYGVLLATLAVMFLSKRKHKKQLSLLRTAFSLHSAGSEELLKSYDQSIRDALKDLENHRKKSQKNALSSLLSAADVGLSVGTFFALSAGWIALILMVVFIGSFSTVVTIISTALAAIAPYWLLRSLEKRHRGRFADEFASAVDVIVRGVRSGLSVSGCFKMIAEEGPIEVRKQFRILFNDLDLGVPLDAAMKRFSERINLPEVKFFAIVISVQSTSGGNLTSALEHLSEVLRERKQLKGKIKALSSEAKTSSWIIGSLPVLVLAAVQMMSPDYSSKLFTSAAGQFILGGSVLWMFIGIFVMMRMIDLEG